MELTLPSSTNNSRPETPLDSYCERRLALTEEILVRPNISYAQVAHTTLNSTTPQLMAPQIGTVPATTQLQSRPSSPSSNPTTKL
ncbi:hypothetical protein TNIN_19831 [Trichonephila inaurata madagascariensis]|uniref:Uncharacterized protein n=1 Tax=Trichonephila inaurata madagascariensis TaxID=2747483 RepID=A0A8X7C503_9ARAC|nr:hypothetical protein TNIN_19831 [Trichonephila inaurata madagascariensis]